MTVAAGGTTGPMACLLYVQQRRPQQRRRRFLPGCHRRPKVWDSMRLTLVIMSFLASSNLLPNRNTSELWACAAMAGRPAIGPHARYLIIVPESRHRTRLAHEPDARARSLGAAFPNSLVHSIGTLCTYEDSMGCVYSEYISGTRAGSAAGPGGMKRRTRRSRGSGYSRLRLFLLIFLSCLRGTYQILRAFGCLLDHFPYQLTGDHV